MAPRRSYRRLMLMPVLPKRSDIAHRDVVSLAIIGRGKCARPMMCSRSPDEVDVEFLAELFPRRLPVLGERFFVGEKGTFGPLRCLNECGWMCLNRLAEQAGRGSLHSQTRLSAGRTGSSAPTEPSSAYLTWKTLLSLK